MNWKQVVYTSAITLVVAVISGILVNWYTESQISKKESEEQLYYDLEYTANFQTDSVKISLYTIKFWNEGNMTAKDVTISVNFDEKFKIIAVDSKLARTNQRLKPKQNKNSLIYHIDRIYKKDKIVVNVALNGIGEKPSIVVQSLDSVGQEYVSKNPIQDNSKSRYFVVGLLTILILAPVLVLSNLLLKRLGRYDISINNNAFLFLHSKQFLIAETMLQKKIFEGGGSGHELSNLALTKLMIDPTNPDSEKLINMAEFINGNSIFIVMFNKFLICVIQCDYIKMESTFLECFSTSKKELMKYIKFSQIVADLRVNDQRFDQFLLSKKL